MTTPRTALGQQGEKHAAAYLQAKGYSIVGKNWRCTQGEFDLIARDGETLVFVEVKTRRAGLEAAFESINPRKRKILERMAYLYLNEHKLDADWRIDVVAVTLNSQGKPEIEHVQDAFDW
jgi:putative endonuclease